MPIGCAVRCTYAQQSVVTRIGKPLSCAGIAINPVQRNAVAIVVGERDVPFFAVPNLRLFAVILLDCPLRPPVSGRPPWPCRPQNLSLQLIAVPISPQPRQLAGTPLRQLHANVTCRTENSQSKRRSFRHVRQCQTPFAAAGFLLRYKSLHAKSIGTPGVQQPRNPRAAFSQDRKSEDRKST